MAFKRSCSGLAVKVEVEVGFSLAFSLHFLSMWVAGGGSGQPGPNWLQ